MQRSRSGVSSPLHFANSVGSHAIGTTFWQEPSLTACSWRRTFVAVAIGIVGPFDAASENALFLSCEGESWQKESQKRNSNPHWQANEG